MPPSFAIEGVLWLGFQDGGDSIGMRAVPLVKYTSEGPAAIGHQTFPPPT